VRLGHIAPSIPQSSMLMTLVALIACAASSGEARAEAIIAGTVEAKEDCAHTPMETWLSSGQTLLYQVEIPQHGSFEFHVNSGKYDLVAVGADGCLGEAEVEARQNDTRRITLKPTKTSPKTSARKNSLLDWILPAAFASDCPNCGLGGSAASNITDESDRTPWWVIYGNTSYPSFDRPGPWVENGIDGTNFPEKGELFALRPVLYVNGPDDTSLKIRVRLSDSTHWLAAIPEHGEKAWSGTIRNNQFKTQEATYSSVFYDYRAAQKQFQDSRGFCADQDNLLPRLKQALKDTGFKKNEIQDFSSYWNYKIPPSERYCVYPQSTQELEPAVHLDIEPKPASVTQLLLIVQVGENLDGKGKFRRAPVATWQPTNPNPQDPRHREPAANKGPVPPAPIEIREWGMGFLEGVSAKRDHP